MNKLMQAFANQTPRVHQLVYMDQSYIQTESEKQRNIQSSYTDNNIHNGYTGTNPIHVFMAITNTTN